MKLTHVSNGEGILFGDLDVGDVYRTDRAAYVVVRSSDGTGRHRALRLTDGRVFKPARSKAVTLVGSHNEEYTDSDE